MFAKMKMSMKVEETSESSELNDSSSEEEMTKFQKKHQKRGKNTMSPIKEEEGSDIEDSERKSFNL
jgi:hypothetical protein